VESFSIGVITIPTNLEEERGQDFPLP